jgi:hypothetical protein
MEAAMSKRAGAILFLLLTALFLAANQGAYRGYFQEDELDTLGWAPRLDHVEYLTRALSPLFQTNNFRPVGHAFFHVAGLAFGLNYPPYVALLHAIHLFNVWLVWLVARRLGAKPWPAGAACVFFALHMALFDAVWKPMYVYDVLCATFCLLSLLAWMRDRWALALVAFWLAYKSKEIAIMLPVALLCYEYWFGQRRWLRLAPFLAISLSFGLQGMLLNPHRNEDSPYTFHFTLSALAATSVFYAERFFLVPYLGFAVPLAAFVSRNRRTWFGVALMGAFFFPLLFLPGRLFAAYCYLPFAGLAVALSGWLESATPALIVAFFLLLAPVEYRSLRAQKRATLETARQVQAWVEPAEDFAYANPNLSAVVYKGLPENFSRWGADGALRFLYPSERVIIKQIDDPGAAEALDSGRAVLLTWDAQARRLRITRQR